MLKVWILVFNFPFVPVFGDFAADCAAMDGVGDKKTIMYKGNCMVSHSTDVDYATARDSCNDFTHGGHLAFIPNMNAFTTITTAFPGSRHFIGLKHPGSADIKKDWWWIVSDQEKYEATIDISPWWSGNGEPNDPVNPTVGGCAYIYTGWPNGIVDTSCSNLFRYICEYGNPRRHKFVEVIGGKIPQPSSVIASITDIHRASCAVICAHNMLCHSYAYKESGGNCLIIPFTVDEIPSPVASSDFKNVDKIE